MWPWRTIRRLRDQVTRLLEENAAVRTVAVTRAEELLEMRRERDYWRSKAELLLDSTLFRRGEITQHVFAPPPKPAMEQTMGSIFGPLAVTEIESGKRRPSSPEDAPTDR